MNTTGHRFYNIYIELMNIPGGYLTTCLSCIRKNTAGN